MIEKMYQNYNSIHDPMRPAKREYLRTRGSRMIFLACLLFTIIAGSARSVPVQAVEPQERYEAKVPVPDKSEQQRDEALRAALRQVIGKITGQGKLADRAALNEALEHPERYVEQFLYQTETPSEPHPSSRTSSGHQLVFLARFDPGSIDELLRSANLPVRGRTRPSILIWLVLKTQGKNLFVGANHPGEFPRALREGASERGISIVLPLLDLNDRSRIDETDVENGVGDRILAASRRYNANTVLAGRVSGASAAGWEANWTFFGETSFGGRTILGDWVTRADEPGQVLRKGVHEAIDILVSRYPDSEKRALADMALTEVHLTVSGIDTAADYARTRRYLENLRPETKVYVTRAVGDRLSFRLSIPGGEATFVRMVGYGTTLSQSTDGDDPITFRLLP